ncbi:MAG: hypothetical protein ACRDM1_08220, partial [Gaiellaceae bacterium]
MLRWPISGFVPQDRLAALAAGATLPSRAQGAALLADIVGFTPLTNGLVDALGEERGAEEVALALDGVFAALVEPVEELDGSVVAFAGDALICWFEGDDGLAAIAAALGMRQALEEFRPGSGVAGVAVPRLGVRVAVAAGEASRLLLGDPTVQVMEALAGAPVDALAAAGHVARPGEVVVDERTAEALADLVELAGWRVAGGGRPCAVVSRLLVAPPASSAAEVEGVPLDELAPWVPRVVFERLSGNEEELLPGIRPAVALFLAVDGFDLATTADGAGRLSRYVAHVQSVLTRYGGVLVDVTTGDSDKGVYLFGAFGVPVAHGDDLLRSVSVAEELKRPWNDSGAEGVRIGLAAVAVYAGVYGAPS